MRYRLLVCLIIEKTPSPISKGKETQCAINTYLNNMFKEEAVEFDNHLQFRELLPAEYVIFSSQQNLKVFIGVKREKKRNKNNNKQKKKKPTQNHWYWTVPPYFIVLAHLRMCLSFCKIINGSAFFLINLSQFSITF